jgi:hypothetical protein
VDWLTDCLHRIAIWNAYYRNAPWIIIKMQGFDICGVQNGGPGVGYPESDGNGSLTDAPTIPKGDYAPVAEVGRSPEMFCITRL